jgi:hypothetical protein
MPTQNDPDRKLAHHTQQIAPTGGSDHSKSYWVVWVPIIVSVMTLAGGGIGWGVAQWNAQKEAAQGKVEAQRAEDDRLLQTYLEPLRAKLQLAASVYDQLTDRFVPGSIGILEWYVSESRRIGPDKLTLPYGLISDLVETNAKLLELIDGYSGKAITPAFKAESSKFREHAHTYGIRFKAVPTIIVSGAPLPSWKTFPAGLPSALDEEIAARQKHRIDPSGTGPKTKFERKFSVNLRTGFSVAPQRCEDAANSLRSEYPSAVLKVEEFEGGARNALAQAVDSSLFCRISVTVIEES